MSDTLEVRLAPAGAVDPALMLASAPFSTWIGAIQIDADGTALMLRSTGDEDEFPVEAPLRAAIAEALAADGTSIEPGSATWLPLARLYPVLHHLPVEEGFDVATRMPCPRVEWIGRGRAAADRIPVELRVALIDGTVGWAGGCPAE